MLGDEPGIYETDEVGIRIENELECVDLATTSTATGWALRR